MKKNNYEPALDCLTDGHIFVFAYESPTLRTLGTWCLWCKTSRYDEDAVTEHLTAGTDVHVCLNPSNNFFARTNAQD